MVGGGWWVVGGGCVVAVLCCVVAYSLYVYQEKALEGKEFKYISIAPYVKCVDTSHLEKFLQDIIDRGGEGIILRDPNSPYHPGNSEGYLKHKKFRDAEAKIVGTVAPGLWECEL